MRLVKYPYEELLRAYRAWVQLFDTVNVPNPKCEMRNEAWDHYCDLRDGLPLGTAKKRRITKDGVQFHFTH